MKILMENKKKQIGYVVVFLACLLVMGWIWVPRFTQKPKAIESSVVASALNISGSSAVPARAGSLLPFGETFDTAILNDARFQALIAPKVLTLDPAELGRVNPFLPPETITFLVPSSSVTTTTPVGGQ